MKKIALGPASIDALQTGVLGDLLTLGLAIEVLHSGKKRWRYRRQVAGSNVAIANKTARTAWALLNREDVYRRAAA